MPLFFISQPFQTLPDPSVLETDASLVKWRAYALSFPVSQWIVEEWERQLSFLTGGDI
jgi:hypothetical protein